MTQRKRKQHGKKTKLRTTSNGRDISDAYLERLRLQVVMLPQTPAAHHQRQQLLVELADVYWSRNEYPSAIAVWQQVLKSAQTAGDQNYLGRVLATLALCYAHSGDVEAAIAHAKRALVFNPRNPEALINLSHLSDRKSSGAQQRLLSTGAQHFRESARA